jgi:hypothetical protein
MLITDSTAVGLIRVEPVERESSHPDGWDDSTLDMLFASYGQCAHIDESSLVEPIARRLVTLARYSRMVITDTAQTVVRSNRAQLLRDLETEYSAICGRLEG